MLPALLLLAGCTGGPMSTLDPAGPAAAEIAAVWWAMLGGATLVFVGMVALTVYAVLRPPLKGGAPAYRRFIIAGGLVFPLTVVAALLIYGVRAGHSLLPLPTDREVFRVEVQAHQWWWEVRYPDAEGGALYGANEIHVPAGRPVDIDITASDVIHSFWVPRLGGKLDALPGRVNTIRLEAPLPGTYRGQCAEFCGAQHARMALEFVAHEEEDLAARLALLAEGLGENAEPPAPAAAEPAPAGQAMPEAIDPHPGAAPFAEHCAACHEVNPRRAGSGAGPNLADLRHRGTLGAGTLRNLEGALLTWLNDHRDLKPGNRMPGHRHLEEETLAAIAAYLEQRPADPEQAP